MPGTAADSEHSAVQLTDFDTTKQTYIQADYNASFAAGGFHTLKVGGGIRHNPNDVDQRYPGGRVPVFWDPGRTSAVPGVAASRGAYGYYTVDDLGTFGAAAANITHFYAQDQWSVGNLTLNLGVRLEDEKIPAFRDRDVAIEFGCGEKIAPRLGAAYELSRRRSREALRQLRPVLRLDEVRAGARHLRRRHLEDVLPHARRPDVIPQLNLDNMPGRDLWGNAAGYQDYRIPSFGTDSSIRT